MASFDLNQKCKIVLTQNLELNLELQCKRIASIFIKIGEKLQKNIRPKKIKVKGNSEEL